VSYPKDRSEAARDLLTLDLLVLDKAGNVKASPTDDVAVVKVVTRSTGAPQSSTPTQFPGPQLLGPSQPLPGVTVKESSSSGIVGVSRDFIKTFAQVNVGNEVIVFGYPDSIGLQQIPQLDPSRPLLRKGIVAGENSINHSIVLDGPIYAGNSGGPVLEIDHEPLGTRFWIIGVVSQFVPYDDIWLNERQGYSNHTLLNSGYSVASPMDAVLQLTK
jgi:hypothetical protein